MELSFHFKRKLGEGKPLIGAIQSLSSAEVTEILATAGFDWLWVDLEHSAIDIPGLQRILQAAAQRCPCLVRSPSHQEVWIKKILDAGPAGIIVPRVNSAEEAAALVGFCRYPPEGCRSVGLSRAQGYGLTFREYVEQANRELALILQIEHIDAVKAIEAIVRVPGIDALLVGPYDLSASMGKTGQVTDPEVQQQIETVRRVCLDAGMPLGIFTTQPEAVNPLLEKGYRLIGVGIDSLYLGQALKQALNSIRQ
jgi:2-keto-3-deoxy-L-rhamnonate aldolase RhmA